MQLVFKGVYKNNGRSSKAQSGIDTNCTPISGRGNSNLIGAEKQSTNYLLWFLRGWMTHKEWYRFLIVFSRTSFAVVVALWSCSRYNTGSRTKIKYALTKLYQSVISFMQFQSLSLLLVCVPTTRTIRHFLQYCDLDTFAASAKA